MSRKESQPLPDFESFTFELTPEEIKEYRSYTPDSVKTIKYLESLDRSVLFPALRGVERYIYESVWGPDFDLLLDKIGGSKVNSNWLAARLIDIVEDKKLSDYDEGKFNRLREELG